MMLRTIYPRSTRFKLLWRPGERCRYLFFSKTFLVVQNMIRQWRGKRQFTLKTILLFIATASVFLAICQGRATVARRAAKELYLEAYRSGFLLNAVMPSFRIVYDKPAGDEGFLDGKNALAQIYPVDVEPFSYNSEVRTRAIIPLVEKATHIRPDCKKSLVQTQDLGVFRARCCAR